MLVKVKFLYKTESIKQPFFAMNKTKSQTIYIYIYIYIGIIRFS